MNIVEAIQERRSVRNYLPTPISENEKILLSGIIKETFSPFGGKVTIRLKEFGDIKEFKPSTYGVIHGATSYFLIGIGSDISSALSAGFQFEQVVLKAWQMGLGTCWIAGTFKENDFDRDQVWPNGEKLQVVSPVGIAAKKGFVEKVARTLLGSQNRKPFKELFFTEGFHNSLREDNIFANSLKMLRLAPSSTNSQPWRCLVEGKKVLFYYIPKGGFSVIDCGIGMCHFYETEKYYGFTGKFIKEEITPKAPENWKYLYSYIRSNS